MTQEQDGPNGDNIIVIPQPLATDVFISIVLNNTYFLQKHCLLKQLFELVFSNMDIVSLESPPFDGELSVSSSSEVSLALFSVAKIRAPK